MHLQAGALLKNGEYKIEKVLGQGGFGITYLAEQISLGRKVALKEFFMEGLCNRDVATSHVSVPSVGSKKLVERFKQKFIKEARMIASFDNNHIISIYDVFEENGTAYYVMEYLGSKSLSAIVNEQGIMSETLAMKYIRQVADALAEVHANNLLHLDVKPANIMLNKKGEAVLIDFGISKHYDEAGNQTSSALIGTSEGYAPIEQYEAGALDSFTPATDIYALGATLFFLLTGTRPPKAGDVMNDGLPELPSEISQTASCAITAAMQPRRKDRPQSIAEFLCLVESGKMQDESDGETELNGNVKAASKREGENLFTHTASESSFDEVKGKNGKLVADEFHSIDVVEVLDSEDGNVIFRGKPSTARLSVSEESQPANNEILPPYSRQNDKDGKMKAASKREGENLFTHTASESSFDEVKVERRNEKERSAGAVISNESEKSQKNKPGKSILLILLLLLIAVAGAWFLFGGTGNGDAPKADKVKKDTPTSPKGNQSENSKAVSEETTLIPILDSKTGKYGFVDKSGNEVIPCKYDGVSPFYEGFAEVRIGDREIADDLGNGYAFLRKEFGKCGFVDKTGKEVIPCKYDEVQSFSEGLACVELNDKSGFIDKSGNVVIPFNYDWAGSFSEGLAEVCIGDYETSKYGFVDKSGNVVIPCKYDNVESFSEGLAAVRIGDRDTGKWGFIDKSGNEITTCKYDQVKDFYNGFAAVGIGEDWSIRKWGLVDKTGKEVIPCKYDGV